MIYKKKYGIHMLKGSPQAGLATKREDDDFLLQNCDDLQRECWELYRSFTGALKGALYKILDLQ